MAHVGTSPGLRPHEPAVRGSYMRLFAEHVQRLPGERRLAVRSMVPASTWEEIERSGMFTWLPIETNLLCTRAVGTQLPRDQMMYFFRTLLLDTARSPLLHGLVESVLRIAVRDPGLYLVWVTKGYQLLFRNAGVWDVTERSPGHALLALRGAPKSCTADALWLDSFAGGLSSLFELKQLAGTMSIVDRQPGGDVIFEARWDPV